MVLASSKKLNFCGCIALLVYSLLYVWRLTPPLYAFLKVLLTTKKAKVNTTSPEPNYDMTLNKLVAKTCLLTLNQLFSLSIYQHSAAGSYKKRSGQSFTKKEMEEKWWWTCWSRMILDRDEVFSQASWWRFQYHKYQPWPFSWKSKLGIECERITLGTQQRTRKQAHCYTCSFHTVTYCIHGLLVLPIGITYYW